MIKVAYDLPDPGQAEGVPEWARWDRYNIEIASTSPVLRIEMNQVLLRQVLAQCFSLRVREVTKTVPGYALVVAPGGIKFPAVKKQPPRRPPEEGIIHLSTIPGMIIELNHYYFSGKMYGVTRPVHDSTGLRGFYDIPFPFAPKPGTNLLAVLGRLGLRVKPDQGTVSKLQILHLDHLRTNCEIGPDAARHVN